jgi:hypothetical protein
MSGPSPSSGQGQGPWAGWDGGPNQGPGARGRDCPGPGNRPTIPDITCFASYVRNTRIFEHDVKAGGLCPRRPEAGRLEPLVKAYGVEVIVTDELATYNLVAQACGLWPRRPTAGSRAAFGGARPLGGLRLRRVGRLIRNFESELGEQVKPILDEVRQSGRRPLLPQDGGKRLLRLGLEIKARFDQRPKAARPGATLQAKAVYLEVIPAVG